MPKEYRTIQEVAGIGPKADLVRGVEGVTYDELGEIELASGETRRCKVLEVNGSDVLVQLFERDGTGNQPFNSAKSVFLEEAWSLACRVKICLEDIDGLGRPIDDILLKFCQMPVWILTDCR